MRKSSIALLFALLALALALPAGVYAANPTATPKPKKTPKTHTVIQSVDASSITVQSGDQKTTYKITNLTEITFKGNTATVADLKPGMRVDVSAGMDPSVAERISADDAPKDKDNAKGK